MTEVDPRFKQPKPDPKQVKDWRRRHAGSLCVLASIRWDCERWAVDPSHIRPRSLGGTHDDANMRPMCRKCHRWAEQNIDEAVRLGVLDIRSAHTTQENEQ